MGRGEVTPVGRGEVIPVGRGEVKQMFFPPRVSLM